LLSWSCQIQFNNFISFASGDQRQAQFHDWVIYTPNNRSDNVLATFFLEEIATDLQMNRLFLRLIDQGVGGLLYAIVQKTYTLELPLSSTPERG